MVTSDTPGEPPAPKDSFLQAVTEREPGQPASHSDLAFGRVLGYVVLVVVIIVAAYALATGRERSAGENRNPVGSPASHAAVATPESAA